MQTVISAKQATRSYIDKLHTNVMIINRYSNLSDQSTSLNWNVERLNKSKEHELLPYPDQFHTKSTSNKLNKRFGIQPEVPGDEIDESGLLIVAAKELPRFLPPFFFKK